MRILALGIAAAAVFVLAGCSASPDRPCLKVSQAELTTIVDSAAKAGQSPKAVAGAAVVSRDFKGTIYIVAIKFNAGGSDSVGDWATDTLDATKSGTILSADSYASTFTVWPDHLGDTKLSASTDGVSAAEACLAK